MPRTLIWNLTEISKPIYMSLTQNTKMFYPGAYQAHVKHLSKQTTPFLRNHNIFTGRSFPAELSLLNTQPYKTYNDLIKDHELRKAILCGG